MHRSFARNLLATSAGAALLAAIGLATTPTPALACGDESYTGTICTFGFNWCPYGWLPTNGAVVPINQYQALYSLLGTWFGGDGRNNFGLPDLRGRVPVGQGLGPGLTPLQQGQKVGNELIVISSAQLPAHTHEASASGSGSVVVQASTNAADSDAPVAGKTFATGNYLDPSSLAPAPSNIYGPPSTPAVDIPAGAVTGVTVTIKNAGGSAPVDIRNPGQGVTYCIQAQGLYPRRP
ncbi:MAG: phage tail protein [Azospirillum sp.]|nr:phage tail protein [Azospirillum sp.]